MFELIKTSQKAKKRLARDIVVNENKSALKEILDITKVTFLGGKRRSVEPRIKFEYKQHSL